MTVDPVEQWLGLARGEWAWSLAWSVVAIAVAAIGVVLATGVGRVRSRITEENTRIGEWSVRGHLLLPKSRIADARRSLSTTAQWMIVLGAFDVALRILVQVFPVDWGPVWLERAEAVAVAVVLMRMVRGLLSSGPAAERRMQCTSSDGRLEHFRAANEVRDQTKSDGAGGVIYNFVSETVDL